jgi:hypothetical protein
MCRRDLLALLAGPVLPWPLAARAAQTELGQAVDFTGQIQNREFDFAAGKNFLFPGLEAGARAAQG